jgi:hypothetical protein
LRKAIDSIYSDCNKGLKGLSTQGLKAKGRPPLPRSAPPVLLLQRTGWPVLSLYRAVLNPRVCGPEAGRTLEAHDQAEQVGGSRPLRWFISSME